MEMVVRSQRLGIEPIALFARCRRGTQPPREIRVSITHRTIQPSVTRAGLVRPVAYRCRSVDCFGYRMCGAEVGATADQLSLQLGDVRAADLSARLHGLGRGDPSSLPHRKRWWH